MGAHLGGAGGMSARRPGVGCGVALVEDGRLMLVLRRRAPEAGAWSLPGGKVDWSERAEQAAAREIREELGVEIEIDDLLCVTQILDGDDHHWVSPVYKAHIVSGRPTNREPDKHERVEWFSLDALPARQAKSTVDAAEALKARGTTRAGLSLGANLGDKQGNIQEALRRLDEVPGVKVVAVSRFYRTAPWGNTDQDWFVNACALVDVQIEPLELLDRLKELETAIGRQPSERWGPRAIDVDLLFYGDRETSTPRLTVPHRSMFERGFVMIPLAEVAGERIISGKRVKDVADALRSANPDVVPLPD